MISVRHLSCIYSRDLLIDGDTKYTIRICLYTSFNHPNLNMNKLLIVSALVLAIGILFTVEFVAATSAMAQMAENATKAGNNTGSSGNMTMNATGQVSARRRP
jgi:hypothetical protein